MTFWSGMLVMGFIGWAWWDSMRYESAVHRGKPMVANVAGFVSIGSVWDISTWGSVEFAFRRDPLGRFKGRMTTPLFPAPLYAMGEAEVGDPFWPPSSAPSAETFTYASYVDEGMAKRLQEDWILLIPHWQVLLAAALPWGGAMVWRGRRMRRGWMKGRVPSDR